MTKTRATDVKAAFKWILGRAIDTKTTKSLVAKYPDHDSLRRSILTSEEFGKRFASLKTATALAPGGHSAEPIPEDQATAFVEPYLAEGGDPFETGDDLTSPAEAKAYFLHLAAHFRYMDDVPSATEALTTAAGLRGADVAYSVRLIAECLALGEHTLAVTIWLGHLIDADLSPFPTQARADIADMVAPVIAGNPQALHGHILLIEAIEAIGASVTGKRLVEIGTARERVPGQNSTLAFARMCQAHGVAFTTVDMDPRNIAQAQQLFEQMQVPFEAVCSVGQAYLSTAEEPVDFVFLDAYDFDHGKHSARRQTRYKELLGAAINEDDCAETHLEFVTLLQDKLAPDGIICIDDTWQDDTGTWQAKGRTAVPYLLENGFRLLRAENRAVLLSR